MVATRTGKTTTAPAPAPAKPWGVAKRGRASAAPLPNLTTKERQLLRRVQSVADVLSAHRRRAGGAGAAVPAGATTMSGALARPFEQRKFTRVFVPDGDRERAAGVPDEYRFEVLIEQAERAASHRAEPVAASSLGTYMPTWRRWMSWAFDDWLERGGGAEGGGGAEDEEDDGYARGLLMNPYKMDASRIERYVRARFATVGKDGRLFTVTTAGLNRSALVNLAEAFAWLDAQRFKQRREEVENMNVDPRIAPAARRAVEVELHRFSVDARWRLCWPEDLSRHISRLDVWAKKKREVGAALKELSKGGAGKSKFNEIDALARSLDNREIHYLHEWIRAARYTSASDYAKWARVRWFILAAEAFLARPGELFSLRRAQLKMHTLYEGMLGAGTEVFALEMSHTKGSQDTTTPVTRYACRHRDVRCCAISALAECLFISFHGEGGRTLQVAQRVTAAQHAPTIRNKKTREAFEANVDGAELLWNWQFDLVCPGKTYRDYIYKRRTNRSCATRSGGCASMKCKAMKRASASRTSCSIGAQ